jgi:hypothetical protein
MLATTVNKLRTKTTRRAARARPANFRPNGEGSIYHSPVLKKRAARVDKCALRLVEKGLKIRVVGVFGESSSSSFLNSHSDAERLPKDVRAHDIFRMFWGFFRGRARRGR